jgi:PAS domain S-box-containing protein
LIGINAGSAKDAISGKACHQFQWADSLLHHLGPKLQDESRSMTQHLKPTGKFVSFGDDEIIVSKTDLRGRITYANDVFIRVARYSEAELLGQPHNFVRHPDMPRCVFKLLWDRLAAQQEIFAYVLNMNASGDGYWVLAHVTPTYGPAGDVISYHSTRRKPAPAAVSKATDLYRQLRKIENAPNSRKDGMQAGFDFLINLLAKSGVGYDEFVLSL